MPIYDLYSTRKEDQARSGQSETYRYDEIPGPLRVQVRKIIGEGLGTPTRYSGGITNENGAYKSINDVLCREYGVDHLVTGSSPYNDLMSFIDRCSTDQFLDVLELSCRMIDMVVRNQGGSTLDYWKRTAEPDSLLEEVNYRLRRAGIGFQFESGMIIRIDSQLIHVEITKPALRLLADPRYAGPQEEFLSAHEHFRHGRYKESIIEAAKAFESMVRAICDRKGWTYEKGSRASDLLKVLRRNHLWPDYLDGSFDQLVATLQSGLPQVRNDNAAHGQGATPQGTPEYIAAYALHLAASKLVLLADAAAAVQDVVPTELSPETV